MEQRRFCSIWELDPRERGLHDYADIARLYRDAYQHRFGLRATPRRLRPYLVRYHGYGVVAPWVRAYLGGERRSHPLAALREAPLDPTFDVHCMSRWLIRGLWTVSRVCVRSGTGGYFEA